MGYTTREYTRLVGNGCDDVTITPNKEFKAFEGDYTVTSYALIKDTESDEVIILKPGDNIKGIGKIEKEVVKPKPKRKRKALEPETCDNCEYNENNECKIFDLVLPEENTCPSFKRRK